MVILLFVGRVRAEVLHQAPDLRDGHAYLEALRDEIKMPDTAK